MSLYTLIYALQLVDRQKKTIKHKKTCGINTIAYESYTSHSTCVTTLNSEKRIWASFSPSHFSPVRVYELNVCCVLKMTCIFQGCTILVLYFGFFYKLSLLIITIWVLSGIELLTINRKFYQHYLLYFNKNLVKTGL